MPRIIWSPPAQRDLREIERYLAQHDPRAAVRILRAIRAKSDQLRNYPDSGPALDRELRYLGVHRTPYLLVYRVAESRIEVVRIRHAREDWIPG